MDGRIFSTAQSGQNILFFGTDKLNAKMQALALNPCQQVKNLGVIFDSDFSFEPHITKNVFYHLKNIARVSLSS